MSKVQQQIIQLWAEYNGIRDEMANAEQEYLKAEKERMGRLVGVWCKLNMSIAIMERDSK